MKNLKLSCSIVFLLILSTSCGTKKEESESIKSSDTTFDYIADRFADIQVLRYQVKGFEKLSLRQKRLVYYLYQAGLSGRDIFYDQKNKNNLTIRKTLEAILHTYRTSKSGEEWNKFITYCNRFFFSNGIHHHYSADKIIPECLSFYFVSLVEGCDDKILPLEGKSKKDFLAMIEPIVYNPKIDPKCVDLSATDVIIASANNFYENVNQQEAENYYSNLKKAEPDNRSQIGFNTKLIKENGTITERVWKSGGRWQQNRHVIRDVIKIQAFNIVRSHR